MKLTLNGLVRALRLAAHGLAEDAEAGYGLPRAKRPVRRRERDERTMQEGKKRDDRRRR